MKSIQQKALVLAIAASASQVSFGADSISEALKESKVSGNFNMRYEEVDNPTSTSEETNLRSRITITSGDYNGFSAVAGFEDITNVLGDVDQGGLIPEFEVTEVDQAFVQYKSGDTTVKVGRQVIALDNQRYVGHVGWRQDRQTYDAIRLITKLGDFTLDASYIGAYDRFTGDTHSDADTFLLNGSISTGIGKLTPYIYILDDEERPTDSLDTYGVRLTGSKGDFGYTAELATQSFGASDRDYMLLEGSYKFSGITAKLGYEVRGSDAGAAGFTVPLGTNHAHNGWADIYINGGSVADGLEDTYISLAGKAGPVNLTAVYHKYDSEFGSTDKGDEIDFVATLPLGGGFTSGLKYASYSQGDATTTPDRDKLWAWITYSF